jgi:hypothetical protein
MRGQISRRENNFQLSWFRQSGFFQTTRNFYNCESLMKNRAHSLNKRQIYKPTYLATRPHTYLPNYPPAHIRTYLPTSPHTCLPTYLPNYPPAHIRTYLPNYPPVNIRKYLPTYLSIYGSTALCWALATFSVFWPSTQSLGLLGRVISPSQGRYLHIGQHKHRINAQRHPCFKPRGQWSAMNGRQTYIISIIVITVISLL